MNNRTMTVVATTCTCIALAACGPSNNDSNTSTNNANAGTNNTTTPGTNNTTGSNNVNNRTINNTTSTTGNTNNNMSPGFAGVAIGAVADFGAGASGFGLVDFGSAETAAEMTDYGSGDVAVSVGDAYAYALDRNGGTVKVLSLDDLSEVGNIDVSAAMPSNPQFAADTSEGTVVIPLYNTGSIAFATGGPGSFTVETVTLEAFDSFDGNPEPSAVLADEQYALVVLQTLQDFVGVESSQLLVINTTDANAFVDFDDMMDGTQALQLGVTNAQAGISMMPDGNVAVGATGNFGEADAGIVSVVRNAAGDYAPGEIMVSESDLGGDLLDFVFVADGVGLATVMLMDFTTKLVRFEITENSVAVEDVQTVGSPALVGLDVSSDGSVYVVAETGDDAAFRAYATDTGDWQGAVSTTLPPAGIELLD